MSEDFEVLLSQPINMSLCSDADIGVTGLLRVFSLTICHFLGEKKAVLCTSICRSDSQIIEYGTDCSRYFVEGVCRERI